MDLRPAANAVTTLPEAIFEAADIPPLVLYDGLTGFA
jgi:hypothetical protein